MENFLPELERVLRSKRGVIACTVAGGRVAVMVSGEADIADVRWTANELAGRHGVSDVVVLAPPAVRVPRKARPLRQTALVAVAAALLITALTPTAGRILPKVKPIVLEPAPAPAEQSTVVIGRTRSPVVLPKRLVRPAAGRSTTPAIRAAVTRAVVIRAAAGFTVIAPSPPASKIAHDEQDEDEVQREHRHRHAHHKPHRRARGRRD